MAEDIKTTIGKNKTIIIISVTASLISFIVFLVLIGAIIAFHFSKGNAVNIINLLLDYKGTVADNLFRTVNRDVVAEESRIIDIVEKVNPAVVSIVITKDVAVMEQYYQESNPFSEDFFEDFFSNRFNLRIPQYRQKGIEKKEIGGGSGFFISADGLIITNKHVVGDDQADYTVFTNDGEKYEAEILAKDQILDIAVLKVKGQNLPYLQFGDSDLLKSGQTVIAIGNALGEFRNSVSAGIVSGLSRSIIAEDFSNRFELLEGVIQTDAAINQGNSGGPLLDLAGNVIGVNVAVERGAQNIGFALPSNTVKSIVASIKEYGEIVRPYLGVRYVQVTESLQKNNNLTVDYGVLVKRGQLPEELAVIPGSPADKAGIIENDIILEIDGVKLKEGKSLAVIIRQKQIDKIVKLKILHKGVEKEVEIKLEKAPD